MTCLCLSNTFQTASSHAPSQWQVSGFPDHTQSSVRRPAGQWPAEMKNSLSDWKTSSLLSVLLGPERADMVGSRHNKSSQNELHLMTSWDILNACQCFLVQVLDGVVQQTLYGQKKERKVMFLEIGQDSGVFKPLTHSWTQAAAKIYIEFTPNHYVVSSVFVSHMALCTLMHVVTALIASVQRVHQPACVI